MENTQISASSFLSSEASGSTELRNQVESLAALKAGEERLQVFAQKSEDI